MPAAPGMPVTALACTPPARIGFVAYAAGLAALRSAMRAAAALRRGHAEAVAVVRNARHHAAHDAAVARPGRRVVEAAEAQRIHHRDGARALGKNVSQDAAHPGARALH